MKLDDGRIAWVVHNRELDSDGHPLARGGITVVELHESMESIKAGVDPLAIGVAHCNSKLDHYNRKIGREIALGRALKNLREKEVP